MLLAFVGRVLLLVGLARLDVADGPRLASCQLPSFPYVRAVVLCRETRSSSPLPLRRLPPCHSMNTAGTFAVEKPRGKTPLQWAMRHLDAALSKSRDRLGQSTL